MTDSGDVPEWFASVAASSMVVNDEWCDMHLPPSLRERLPEHLRNAQISRGAVHDPYSSVRLNGPPGTGKTTEICLRLAYLIEVVGVSPDEITVATYRRSLADTVTKRLESWGVIDTDVDGVWYWNTAHAVANRTCHVLEYTPDDEDSDLGPAVTTPEKIAFCSDYDIQYHADGYGDGPGELLFKLFEYCRNNLLDPTDAADVRRAPMFDEFREKCHRDIETMYREWREYAAARDWVEFSEMLTAAARESASLPPARVVVIDEYHDAYPLLAVVAQQWVEAADTAIVAGDPLQVVNSYAGADPRFFTEQMDNLPEVQLDETYRVPEEVWQLATRLLNAEHTAPDIHRVDDSGRVIEHSAASFSTGAGMRVPRPDEAFSPAWMVDNFVEYSDDRDVLFLARTRSQCKVVSKALDKAGVVHSAQDLSEFTSPGSEFGWSARQVSLLNALIKLRLVPASWKLGDGDTDSDSDDGDSSGGVQQSLIDSGDVDVSDIELSLSEAASVVAHTDAQYLTLSADERERKVQTWRHQVDSGIEYDDVSVHDLDELVKPKFWRVMTAGAAAVRKGVISASMHSDDVAAVQAALTRRNSPVSDDERDRVRVLTIHASKGSEATDVVLYPGVSNRVQTEMQRSADTRENEARTWYVACTRASERLHIMRDAFSWTECIVTSDVVDAAQKQARRVRGESGDTDVLRGTRGGDDGVVTDD